MFKKNLSGRSSLQLASISLMLLLIGCAAKEAHFADTASDLSNPVVVTSKLSADVTDYASAKSGKGGIVERKDISGYVLMPVGTFNKYQSDMQRAEAAISRAEAAVQQASNSGLIFETYARACREDVVCDKVAAARVQSKLNSVQKK